MIDSLELPIPGLARRCRCDRPCLIADPNGVHCMKCGRLPAVHLGATADAPAEPGSLLLQELAQ